MVVDLETGRSDLRNVEVTVFNLEDLPAQPTMEVMVMAFARDLVASCITRQLHLCRDTFVDELFERSIDRRDA
ncbi:MAG: hypothetical protein U0165_10985 [Polyangiaceae bacterium]